MAEPRFCELCGVLTPEAQVVDGKFYCSKCVARLESGASKSSVEDASLRDRVPGAPPEKMKFRCLGCNALLSVTPVDRRSKLTCPQCKTAMYIEPGGLVEPVHKVAQSTEQQKEGVTDEPPPIFGKDELDKMLDMGMQKRKGSALSEETADLPSAAKPPSLPQDKSTGEIPPTRGIQKPKKEPPKLKIQPRSRLAQYRKIAAGLPTAKENKPLLIIAVILLVLPGIFALIVLHSDLGKGLKEKLVSPTDTFREGVKRVMDSIGGTSADESKEEETTPEKEKEGTPPESRVEKKTEEKIEEPSGENEPKVPEEKKPEEENTIPEAPPKTK